METSGSQETTIGMLTNAYYFVYVLHATVLSRVKLHGHERLHSHV